MKKILFILVCLPLLSVARIPSTQTYDARTSISLYQFVINIFSPYVVTTYYVSNTGNNSNSGTSEGSPWQTMSKVISSQASFNAGDFILFKRGDTFTGGSFVFTKTGSAGNPITYGAYGSGANPLFTGTGSTITYLFYMNGPDYLTFTDIDVTDPSLDAEDPDREELANIQRVFYVDAGSSNIVCNNMTVTLVGVGVYWVGDNNTMSNCHYSNMRMVEDDPGGVNDYGANPVTCSSSGNLVTHCQFRNLWAHSFDFTYDGGAIEMYNTGGSMDNNTIEYCFIDYGIGVSEITGDTDGFHWRYNIIINNGSFLNFQPGYSHSNCTIYNNVFVLTESSLVGDTRLFYGDATARTMKNNIFYMRGSCDIATTGTNLTQTHNYFNLGTGSTIGFTAGTGSITDNSSPMFNTMSGDENTWNYRLAEGSPAIAAGTTTGASTTDYEGNPIGSPPNMGAYGPAVVTQINHVKLPFKVKIGGSSIRVTRIKH